MILSGALQHNTPLGLVVSGNGTVVISSGNTYNEEDGSGTLQPVSTVAADLQSGTTLITNTSATTSAFGKASSTGKSPTTGLSITQTNVVKLEAGATLGGTGYALQQIVAEAGNSVSTAGDPGQANLGIAPTIGTLHLYGTAGSGGLTTTGENGLTMDFKINGAANDQIDFAGSDLTLNGPVDMNIVNLGTVLTDHAYTLLLASASAQVWTGDATFNIVAPTGYALDTSYNGTGYDYDTAGHTFTVEFAAVPEPSAYALMGLGLLTLVAIRRFRCLGA